MAKGASTPPCLSELETRTGSFVVMDTYKMKIEECNLLFFIILLRHQRNSNLFGMTPWVENRLGLT